MTAAAIGPDHNGDLDTRLHGTLLEVKGLARPSCVVEIEITAAQ